MCEVWSVKIYLHENALIGIIYSIVIRKTKIKRTDMGLCSKSYDLVLKQYIFLSIMHLCIDVRTF